ncbi:hypothetical protein DEO72_LG8g1671 [Vigna unguiculata]|uniref:Uncharacterized protein n=1 Tax=Vigna unguiculata TaxID=3917 RepID=A0A4D6MQ86_VIGUN|nr:hypothetical protein DEO72_LG8g1671 [Vigna unguiculata]
MQTKDKGDGIEDSPLHMLLVIPLEGASMEVSWLVTSSSNHDICDPTMEKQNLEMNVDPNMEHLDQILVETVDDSIEDEEMTYISIDDRIKSLVDPFKKFKNI